MPDPIKVLYWGHEEWTPIPYYRGQQFRPYWPENGLEVTYLPFSMFLAAREDDWRPLRWADVVVFRRWYQDPVSYAAWDRAAELGKARVYDTDDWDVGTPAKIPRHKTIIANRGFVERMAREADVVTTATPVLAGKYRSYARREPLVLRNATDLSLYGTTEPRKDDRPTAVFYGSQARLRDYFGSQDDRGRFYGGYAYLGVREARMRSIWIGDEGTVPIPVEFDEVVRFDHDMREFYHTLANTRAEAGLAPLLGDGFDFCKSELHWLDYSAAGIPVVAQRMMGPNPYSPIRHGVDGLLAKGAQEWITAVGRLAREPDLRADLISAARERLVADYDPRKRAAEWACAFRTALAGA